MESAAQTRTIAFRVPDPVADDLERRARLRGYMNVSEMMRALVREDSQRHPEVVA